VSCRADSFAICLRRPVGHGNDIILRRCTVTHRFQNTTEVKQCPQRRLSRKSRTC
jgi:hypothetical protein